MDLGLNLDMYMVYHLQSPCVEVPSPSSDHVEGFVVWTLPAEILDKSYSGKCQSPRKHLDVIFLSLVILLEFYLQLSQGVTMRT